MAHFHNSFVIERRGTGSGGQINNRGHSIPDCLPKIGILFLVLLLGAVLVFPASAAQGWMFRADPAHTGAYDDSGIQPIAGIRWSSYTNGEVTSSPAVVDGIVYVGSNDHQVYTFNTADGTKIWSTYTNGEVTSSPAVVDGIVYVGSSDHKVYAFNTADGTKIWSTYTNGEVTSSPAVVDGIVYVGSSDHKVYAFNTADGTKIWSTYTNGEVTSSPAVVQGVVYVGSSDHRVYAFNAATGSKIWDTYTNGAVTSSPAVAGGVIYVGSNDNQVYAFNAADGTKIWSTYTNGAVTSSPAVVDGVVYVGSKDLQIYAFNATTGSKIWSTYTSGEVTSSPAVVNGVVYIGSKDLQVYAFNAATGSKLWSTYTNGEVTSSPAVVDGVVYIGSNDRQVYALNAADGTKMWSYYTNGEVTSSPAVVDGVVYIGSSDRQVYAFGNKVPVPAFTASPASGPSPLTVTFTDSSTGDITSWHWDFGDGSSSTLKNPVHTYPGPGTYTVNLTVTGPGGTRSLVIPEYILVTFDFSGTPGSGESPLTVTFSDTLPADTTSRHWDFGDGSTSTDRNPVHTYNTPGSFSVTLNATGPGWAATLQKKNYISVRVIPDPTLRWKFQTGITSVGSPPVLYNSVAYIDGGTTLFAVDTRTGTERWRFATGAECSVSEIYGGVVYVRAGTTLYALDAHTGGEKWRFTAPENIGPHVRYGTTLYFNSGNTIYALDPGNGAERWHFSKNEDFTELTVWDGLIFGGAGKNFYAIDTGTGTEKWHKRYSGETGMAPVVSEGLVIFGTSERDTSHWVRWTFHAVGLQDGTEHWSTEDWSIGFSHHGQNSPQIADGIVCFEMYEFEHSYLTYDHGCIIGIDVMTGEKRWVYYLDSNHPEIDPCFVSEGDEIFSWYTSWYRTYMSVVNQYHMVLLDPNTGNTLWRKSLPGPIHGTPAITQDTIYAAFGGRVHAIDRKTGNILYSTMGDGSPVVSGGVIYTKGSDGYLYAVGNPLSFSATPANGMAPLFVAFQDATPQKTSAWSWDFGDGTLSSEQNPVHTYSIPGTYTVKFTASDASGIVSHTKVNYIQVQSNLIATGVSPVEGVRGTTVPITITGGNFTSGMSANLTRGALVIPLTNDAVADSTTLSGVFTIPDAALVGLYDLTVTRTSDGNIIKIPGAFRVLQFPAPTITSIDPTSTKTGTLQRFALAGSNFQLGATVVFTNPAGSKLTTTAVTNSESEIILTATFPANGIGPWNVTVTNPDGGTATLQNALEVMPTNADTPAPVVTSVKLSGAIAGRTVAITILGSDFTKGSSVMLTRGSEEIAATSVVTISTTQLFAKIPIPSGAATGLYDLVVTNNWGQAGMLPGAMSVTGGSPPMIMMLSPGTMSPGSTREFILSGNRFQQDATVVFSHATYGSLHATDVVVDTRKITATLTLPEDAATGDWSVTVTNPGGGSATLPDALAVIPSPTDEGYAPVVTSVSPASGLCGKTVSLIIKGTNFTKDSSVMLAMGSEEIAATRFTTIGTTQIFATVPIPSNATTGSYDLVVTDSTSQTALLPGGFSVLGGSAPTILILSPVRVYLNATWDFSLSGNHFQPNATVVFSHAEYGVIPATGVVVDAKKITGALVLPAEAATGKWNVTVTNPDGGSKTREEALTVEAWQEPAVTVFMPSMVSTNSTKTFTLMGAYFQAGTTVSIRQAGSPDLPVTDVNVASTTTITGTLTVSADAATGKWDLVVRTPDGGTTVKTEALTVVGSRT